MHRQRLKKKAQQPDSSGFTRRASGLSTSYPKTRIRGSRLLDAARILAFIELSRRLHQACEHAYDKQAADRLLPQKSTCADFIDKMLNIVQGPSVTGAGTQANAGRLLARWAGGALATQARNNPSIVPSGFKAKYVDGGQNLFAPVHIAGVAGGTL